MTRNSPLFVWRAGEAKRLARPMAGWIFVTVYPVVLMRQGNLAILDVFQDLIDAHQALN